MAFPSYTYTLTNGTTANASEVMENFQDILDGVSDGTKDANINALTCAGTATLNGNVVLGNATSDTVTYTARVASAINPSASATYALGASSLAWTAITLDNGSTDSGAVYFDAGTTRYLKGNAAGTLLDIAGFSTVAFTETTSAGTTDFRITSNNSNGTSKLSIGHSGDVDAGYMQYNVSAGSITFGTNGNASSATLSHPAGGAKFKVGGFSTIYSETSSGDTRISSNDVDPAATSHLTIFAGGGVNIGSPTGGNKGAGTLNAVGVYDDNVLLTDYVFEKYFTGKPVEEKHASYEMKSLDEERAYVRDNLHLSTIVGRAEWEEEGTVPMGKLISQLWETVETQFLYICQLDEQIKYLAEVLSGGAVIDSKI